MWILCAVLQGQLDISWKLLMVQSPHSASISKEIWNTLSTTIITYYQVKSKNKHNLQMLKTYNREVSHELIYANIRQGTVSIIVETSLWDTKFRKPLNLKVFIQLHQQQQHYHYHQHQHTTQPTTYSNSITTTTNTYTSVEINSNTSK